MKWFSSLELVGVSLSKLNHIAITSAYWANSFHIEHPNTNFLKILLNFKQYISKLVIRIIDI